MLNVQGSTMRLEIHADTFLLGCYSVVWWVISMCCKKVIGRLFMKVFHFVDQHWLPQRWNHDELTSSYARRTTSRVSTGKERDEKNKSSISMYG